MKNNLIKITIVASLMMLQTTFKIDASTITLNELAGTVELYLANGTQVTTTYVSPSTGSAIGNYAGVRFGTFTGGFAPTLANSASWFSNFSGINGYLGLKGAGLNEGRLADSITAGNLNAITSYVTGNSGVDLVGTKTLAANSQLYAIIWNAPYVSNNSGGSTFYPGNLPGAVSNGVQAAILTNTSWIMPTTSGSGTDVTAFTLSAGTTALIGALDLPNKGITMVLIPEPSSASLLALGMAGLVALRIRRKS
jgi:hypothetical protein